MHCKFRWSGSLQHHLELSAFCQEKRDLFLQLMSASEFNMVSSNGTCFQLADYSTISDESNTEFAVHLTRESKVAVIPISVFYKEVPKQNVVRFCFAKNNDTLREAADKLLKI